MRIVLFQDFIMSREKINFLRASAGRWGEMGQRRLSLLLTCDEAVFQCQVSCDILRITNVDGHGTWFGSMWYFYEVLEKTDDTRLS